MNRTACNVVAVLLAVVTTFAILAGFGPTYRHAEFTVELPDGWHVASPEAIPIDDIDAVFLSAPWGGDHYEFPFAQVHAETYPENFTEEGAKELMGEFTSVVMDVAKRFDQPTDVASATLDWPNRRFTADIMTMTPYHVQLEMIGCFGRNKLVILTFYDTPDHWGQSLPQRITLRDSLTVTLGYWWDKDLGKALIGSVVVGGLAVALWRFSIKNKRRSELP